jgi:DNA-binding phage protein
MTKAAAPTLTAFDAARYLDDPAAIAEYLSVVLEIGDPDLTLLALRDVATALCAKVAKERA